METTERSGRATESVRRATEGVTVADVCLVVADSADLGSGRVGADVPKQRWFGDGRR